MVDEKALLYSLDSVVTLWQLKSWDYSGDFDGEKLKKRMKEREIFGSVVWEDAHYKFSHIHHKPYIIYSSWDIWLLDYPLIAIVWPRKMSVYQERVVRDFFAVLQQYHVVTISWWAPWVDSLAHTLSLQYWLATVMVLWAWFHYYLRSSKRHLLDEIVRSWWLIISEFRLREKPAPRTFPQRNRIIAGLSEMVFLPWAAKKSWSLITVDFAHKMHICVYGVASSIYDDESAGSNAYIAEWKIFPLIEFASCLDLYFTKKNPREKGVPALSPDQEVIYKIILESEMTVEDLVKASDRDLSNILSVLMELEIEWVVREVESGKRSVVAT